MSKTVNARFANGVFTPLEPVAFPEGAIVALRIEADPTEPVEPPPVEPTPGNAGQSILDMFDEIHRSIPEGAFDDLPTDLSVNLKHYLYGWPKEEDR
ncbi:MAG: antitoxin family protein [Chloroflexota bacterium]|nr:antitoxin family protein [Chloroflexota bacterium]MDE2960954.1 antitoxin family protein [Chloroflexota bacterium]